MNASVNADQSAYAVSSAYPAEDELAYQSFSRGAVGSVLLAILGGLSFWFVGLIILPIIGLVLAVLSLLAIRRYPGELLGKGTAQIGLAGCLLVLAVSPAYHTYVYLTEVPEGYERIAFSDLMMPTGAEDRPTDKALELDGKQVFVKGYIHPTSMDAPHAKRFVLVPDFGTCCFGGQPPLTHMIEVTLSGDDFVTRSTRKQKLAGTLKVNRMLKPVEGLNGVFYQLKVDLVR
ncbi:MAG: DUF3299 domain-containing protein [Pirellulales bacterium]